VCVCVCVFIEVLLEFLLENKFLQVTVYPLLLKDQRVEKVKLGVQCVSL